MFALVVGLAAAIGGSGAGASGGDLFPREDEGFSNSAYIRISEDVRSLLYNGDRAAREGDIGAALHAYQSILDQHADELVDLTDRTSVSGYEAARRRLKAMPEAARRRYEELFGDNAREAVRRGEAAFDAAALIAAAERFPVAAAGARALRSAARLAEERGRPLLVERAVEMLLRDGLARPEDLARLAVALSDLGDVPGLESLRRRATGLDRPLRIGEERTTLGDLIESCRGRCLPPDLERRRSRIEGGEVVARTLARLPFEERVLGPRPVPDPRRVRPIEDPPPIDGADADRGTIVVGQQGVYWLEADSAGAPVEPRLRFDRDLSKSNYALVGNRSLRPVAVGERFVFPFTERYEYQSPVSERGQLVFVRMPEPGVVFQLFTQLDDQPEELRDYVFEGPAVRFGDRILIIGSRLRTLTECSLFQFDRDGNLEWATHLASGAEVERYELRNQPSEASRAPPAPIALRDGVVYCVTNLGVAAAVDAWTGRVRWLFKYHRITPDDPERLEAQALFDTRGWRRRAPIPWTDSVIVAPEDSRYLYRLAKEIGPRGELRLQEPLGKAEFEALVGAYEPDAKLVVLSREVAGPSFDRPYFTLLQVTDAGIGRLYGHDGLLNGEELTGTPLLLGKTLFAPTDKSLRLYDLERGLLNFRTLPIPEKLLRDREDRYFGNLSDQGDSLLSVSPGFVVRVEPARD